MKKEMPVMEFVFQNIKLDQVAELIPSHYRSKYEIIRQQVIEKIKSMPEDETFMFQPQDKKAKLDDNLVARICHGINVAIIRESLNWKIAYSEKVHAFVVAPFKRYKLKPRTTPNGNGHTPPAKLNGNQETMEMQKLLKLTHTLFGFDLKDLQIKLDGNKNPDLSATKKAFIYVGRKVMGIKLSQIGKLLELSSASTTTSYKRASQDEPAIEKAQLLADAINKGAN